MICSRNAGFEVLEAVDGEKGVAMAAEQRPDLILMDIQPPIVDGYEATRRIKANPDLRHIPIIAVTSVCAVRRRCEGICRWMRRLFRQAIQPARDLAKVREFLDLAPRGPRLRNPPRILVVDDNPTNLEVLRVRLNSQGYEVVTAVDGEDALVRARELDPDLVLLDVMMPKLDGISVPQGAQARCDAPFYPRHSGHGQSRYARHRKRSRGRR